MVGAGESFVPGAIPGNCVVTHADLRGLDRNDTATDCRDRTTTPTLSRTMPNGIDLGPQCAPSEDEVTGM